MSELSTNDERPARGSLVISRGVTIVGSVYYDGQIQVEGAIDGEVRCNALQITERGAVKGLIVAERVDVLGEANGSIYANKLVLGAACAVEGEIYHHNLVLEDERRRLWAEQLFDENIEQFRLGFCRDSLRP